MGSDAVAVPKQYRNGFDQLSRNMARAQSQVVLNV